MLLCACGNLSNEDVAFLVAIPQKGSLHVQVPQAGAGQTACLYGTADVWLSAKKTGDDINAGIDNILAMVDFIRSVPPNARDTDSRTWGPWADKDHPGVEFRIGMTRLLDAKGVPWSWEYAFEARRKPGAFLAILSGVFYGAEARNGIGKLVIHFDNSVTLGINKPTDPTLPAYVYYDLGSDPHTVSLVLSSDGLGLLGFDYSFAGYRDGHGLFDYAYPTPNGCRVEVTTKFTGRGAGKGHIHFICGGGIVGDVDQCWDESACLTYVNDSFEFTPICKGIRPLPCLRGSIASCPALP
jgi:hypothetical protein